jgi:EAL domain-containing protein (putative c-di-GMP-specific phosphodiesterase class I)
LPVIAEGVETEDERVFLMKEGCPEIQGYLVGHPHPIALYKDVTDGLSPGSALGGSDVSSAAAQAFGVTG